MPSIALMHECCMLQAACSACCYDLSLVAAARTSSMRSTRSDVIRVLGLGCGLFAPLYNRLMARRSENGWERCVFKFKVWCRGRYSFIKCTVRLKKAFSADVHPYYQHLQQQQQQIMCDRLSHRFFTAPVPVQAVVVTSNS